MADEIKNDDVVNDGVDNEKVTKKEDSVTLSRVDFEKLIGTVKTQNEKIDLLFKVADKARLAKLQGAGESLIKVAKVSRWPDNNKIVIGWGLTKNQSEIINGRWIEDQKVLLMFEGGDNQEVSLLDFYRKIVKEKVEIVKKSIVEEGGTKKEFYTVRFSDGRELGVDSSFIN